MIAAPYHAAFGKLFHKQRPKYQLVALESSSIACADAQLKVVQMQYASGHIKTQVSEDKSEGKPPERVV